MQSIQNLITKKNKNCDIEPYNSEPISAILEFISLVYKFKQFFGNQLNNVEKLTKCVDHYFRIYKFFNSNAKLIKNIKNFTKQLCML